MDINAVTTSIFEVQSKADLKLIGNALKARWNELNRREATNAALQFKVKDRVEWDSRKTGYAVQGTIERFGPKNVTVKTDGGEIWRVAPSLLRHAAKLEA